MGHDVDWLIGPPERRACFGRGREMWPPENSGGKWDPATALAICAGCASLARCTVFALTHAAGDTADNSVIGGLTADDRAKHRKARRLQARPRKGGQRNRRAEARAAAEEALAAAADEVFANFAWVEVP